MKTFLRASTGLFLLTSTLSLAAGTHSRLPVLTSCSSADGSRVQIGYARDAQRIFVAGADESPVALQEASGLVAFVWPDSRLEVRTVANKADEHAGYFEYTRLGATHSQHVTCALDAETLSEVRRQETQKLAMRRRLDQRAAVTEK